MNYKPSYYNFIYDDLGHDKVVFYNSRTGALAVVKEKQYKEYQNFACSGKEINDLDFFDKLQKCGYIVPSEVDEFFLVHTRMLKGRYGGRNMVLTIAPTMACNFRCVYCFEQGHYGKSVMTAEVMDQLVDFFEKQTHNIEQVSIIWFGGEPLLALPIIENLSNRMISICNTRGIKYSARIITNGYLLTPDVEETLIRCKISSAQITVDGSKDVHDRRRPLINGSGTYDVITNNLINLKGKLRVDLRINADIDNIDNAKAVVGFLKNNNLLSVVKPYLAVVLPHNSAYEKEKCLSNGIYARHNIDFLLDNSLPITNMYPRPKSNYCTADTMNSWVIDEKGLLYRCWNDIGILDRSVGTIKDGGMYLYNTQRMQQYMSFDPTQKAKCRACKLLPICVGGCPYNRLDDENYCEEDKYLLHEYMLICSKILLDTK